MVQDENEENLRIAEIECSAFPSSKPENRLKKHNAVGDGIGTLDSIGAFFGGSGIVEKAQNYFNELIDIYKHYVARYNVSFCKAKLVNDEYMYIRQKAILYSTQIREITENLSIKNREAFNASIQNRLAKIGNISDGLSVNAQNTERALRDIRSFNAKSRNMDSKNFQKSLTEYNFKAKHGGTSTTEDVGVLLTLLSGGISNIQRSKEVRERLGREQTKLYNKIKKLNSKQIYAEAFELRVKELNKSLNKSMEAFGNVFLDVYNVLYPKGDNSKSKEARAARKNKSESAFTEYEEKKIQELAQTAVYMMKIADDEL
jgi:hypothetical protein